MKELLNEQKIPLKRMSPLAISVIYPMIPNIECYVEYLKGWGSPEVHKVRRETPTKLALDNFAWPLG